MTNTTMPASATTLRERMKVHRLCRTTQRNDLRDVERFASPSASRATSATARIMTPGTDEFIRRFLIHVLPRGFHRGGSRQP